MIRHLEKYNIIFQLKYSLGKPFTESLQEYSDLWCVTCDGHCCYVSMCIDDHSRVVLPVLSGMTNSNGNYIAAASVYVGLCDAYPTTTQLTVV